MTSVFQQLNIPALYACTTENISDKPSGKYGNIIIFKLAETRATAFCITVDGMFYINSYNTSTSTVTGWKQL